MNPNNIIAFATEVGITLALLTVGGVFFGLFLDKRFDMAPWGLLIGMFVGILLATTVLIIRTRNIMK